jgi:hypothetical protein
MVHEVSDYYTDHTIKDIGRDCKIFVKGISEVKIRVAVYYKPERK